MQHNQRSLLLVVLNFFSVETVLRKLQEGGGEGLQGEEEKENVAGTEYAEINEDFMRCKFCYE